MGGRRIGIASVGVLAWGLACSGLPAAESHENSDACRAYRRAVTALDCAGEVLEEADCPAALDEAACDYPAYYRCMTAALACADGGLDVSAQLACTLVCD